MKIGVVLPTFHDDAALVLDLAAEAEKAGLDGVFVFDHLWHLGKRGKPALSGPALFAAIAATTHRVLVGTLVARVGLVPNQLLCHQFQTAARIAPGRVIAGLGIGDGMSRAENLAFGLGFRPREHRIGELVDVCRLLKAAGIETWVGGLSHDLWSAAASQGATINLWDSGAQLVAEANRSAPDAPVTWAGLVKGLSGLEALPQRLQDLESAGCSWAVLAPVGAKRGDVTRLATTLR